jgi:hypothetical protein
MSRARQKSRPFGGSRHAESASKGFSELLVGPQVPPLAYRQSSQRYIAAADSLQPGYEKAHQLAHAADLALAALAQDEAELVFVLP